MSKVKRKRDYIIDNNWIQTPDMGEYLDNDMILDLAKDIANGETGAEYFIESPFSTELGYHKEENVFVISGKPSFVTDGDTIGINYSDIIDGNRKFTNLADNKVYNNTKEYLYQTLDLDSNVDTITIRLIGINAPEIPHCRVTYTKKNPKIVYAKFGELLNNTRIQLFKTKQYQNCIDVEDRNKFAFIYYNYSCSITDKSEINIKYESARDKDSWIKFLVAETDKGNVYYEIMSEDVETIIESDIDLPKKLICIIDDPEEGYQESYEYHTQALNAKNKVQELVDNASEILYILDGSTFKHQKDQVPFEYRAEWEKMSDNPLYAFESYYNLIVGKEKSYTRLGYRYFGQDFNQRIIGAMYVKYNHEKYGNVWINVAKYIAFLYSLVTILPNYNSSVNYKSNYNYNSSAFKLWTYDKNKQLYIDTFQDFYSDMGGDDRKKVQQELTGEDLDNLSEYTCMIGDVLLTVPPTSIRLVSQTQSQRTPLIRSKGAVTKSIPKNERILEMQLYFNTEYGINGYPYEQKTPSGDTMIYYMNGLRSLVAEFKFLPYLPITNNYINKVLNIEAVSLNSIEVNTVPNFPRTIQATIRLQEFEYRQLMPEILPPDVEQKEDLSTNLFAKTIHFPVMRYYYQRALVRGENAHNLEFNSDAYLNATIGQQTALQPMSFKSPLFDLYIANEENLKQRKQLKDAVEKKPFETVVQYTDKEKEFLHQLGLLYSAIKTTLHDSSDLIDRINTQEGGIAIFPLVKEDANKIEYSIFNKETNQLLYSKEFCNDKFINPLKNSLKKVFASNEYDRNIITDYNFATRVANNKMMIGLKIKLAFEKISAEILNKIKLDYGKAFAINTELLLKDNCVFVGYSADVDVNSNIKLVSPFEEVEWTTYDKDIINADTCLLAKISNDFGNILNSDGTIEKYGDDLFSQNQELAKIKDNMDLETSSSIKFDKYDLGHPIITGISVAYNNNFSQFSLNGLDGYASQYLGGSDTMINIEIQTKDENVVNQLQVLPRICTQRLINYRKIMTSSPIRIDCELTRLMGVNEVIIESVDINTIPNFPGLYNISLRLQSVDRTLRNREALKKLKTSNESYNNDSKLFMKDLFSLNNELKQIDLYPDLELPTIAELEKLGYYFIRYKKDEARIFPDADFYYVYLHAYSAEMIRESVVNFFADEKNQELYHEIIGDLYKGKCDVTYHLSPENNTLLSTDTVLEEDEALKALYKSAEDSLIDSAPVASKNTTEALETVKQLNLDKQKMILKLQENLESSSYAAYDFNHQIKLSINDKIPFDEATNLLTDGSIRYVKDNKLEYGKVNDVAKSLKETLMFLIKECLSKPIEQGKNTIFNSDINNIFEYLCTDVLCLPDGVNSGYTYLIETNKVTANKTGKGADENTIVNSIKEFITNKLRIALSSGASGTNAIIDYDKKSVADNIDNWIGCSQVNYIDKNGNKVKVPNILTACNGQGISNYVLLDEDDDKSKGLVFGPYGIKKYDPKFLGLMIGTPITNGGNGFLDPYYNNALYNIFFADEIKNNKFKRRIDEDYETEYIKKITSDDWDKKQTHIPAQKFSYSSIAAMRNLLVWFYKLLKDDESNWLPTAFLSIRNVDQLLNEENKLTSVSSYTTFLTNSSVGRFLAGAGLDIDKFAVSFLDDDNTLKQRVESAHEEMEKNQQLSEELEETLNDIKDGLIMTKVNLLCGLFTTLGALYLCGFTTPIYQSICSGSIKEYADYVEDIKNHYIDASELSDTDLMMRRYFSYLDYDEYINKNGWNNYIDPLKKYSSTSMIQRVYLEAAEIPSIYLLHSFYDMLIHDMRGRMARAFPTYYMLLIDEGRDLGMWHLQDNFYDVSSIIQFDVVKSRKIAADTANIVMTNLFGTFTSEDEDMKDEYTYTFKDAWNSIFSPRIYYQKEYTRRKTAREFNRAKLKPGARVHLRFGYEGDASRLPVLFNGCVAEVNTEDDIINIICQGDGVELANPDMFNPTDSNDVADMENSDKLLGGLYGMFNNKTTPRDLLLNPLICKGTFIQSVIRDWSDSRFFNDNPFGIVHFGDKYYRDIFLNNGEVEQNIYEALNKPTWSTSGETSFNESLYEMDTPPQIKVGLEGGKSYWDLMNIAASVSPDFICAIAPFNLRSTIFHGAPRYYYAYDYTRNEQGNVVEKRKPFQQYHVFSSYTDIIANNISASSKDIRTCAIGVYTAPGILASTTKTVGPLYLDIDIYPEKQQMTTINCNFEYRNTNLPFTLPIIDDLNSEWAKNGGDKIAWRATASGLRDTVKDMYTGELIILGDPTVKPYDKMMIYDTYEDISGICEVETVVQSFNITTGYTTAITPDCIACVDDKYEKVAHNVFKDCLFPALADHTILVTLSAKFAHITRSIFFSMSQSVKTGGKYAESIAKSLAEIVGYEDMKSFSPLIDKSLESISGVFKATPSDYRVYSQINNIADKYKNLTRSHKLTNASNVSELFSDIAGYVDDINSLNTTTLKDELTKALSETTNPTSRKEIETALSNLDKYVDTLNDAKKVLNNATYIDSSEIKAILNAMPDNLPDDLKKSYEFLDAIKDTKITKQSKNFTEVLEHLSKLGSRIDDLNDGTEVLKVLKNIDKRIFTDTADTLKDFNNLSKELSAVNKVKKGATSLKTVVASNLLWLCAELVITKSIQEYIERKLKNLQVLTVFPLIKNTSVMTAGLDGSKGSVFDSPTYNESGFIEDMAIKFFSDKEGSIFPLIRDLLIDTSTMKEIVDNYKRDTQESVEYLNQNSQVTSMSNRLLSKVIHNEVSGIDAYRQLFLQGRVSNPQNNDGQIAFTESTLVDIENPEENKRIRNELNYIFADDYCKKFNNPENKDRQVLFFSAQKDTELENEDSQISTCELTLPASTEGTDSETVKCKYIRSKNKELPVYDIPYLRNDAIIVLRYIIEQTIKTIQPDAESENSSLSELHKHNIIVHNCTRINEKNSWFSTGYAFTIQCKDYDNFGTIIEDIYSNQNVIVNKNNEPSKLFYYKKDSSMGDNTYMFIVSPTI